MSKKQNTFKQEPTEIPVEMVFNGAFVKQKYMKCPFLENNCRWRLGKNHGSFTYLNNACYLSGSFELKCPE
jgi:hypothetical protein